MGVREHHRCEPAGDSTDTPGADDLHLEPVSVEGVGTVLVLDVRGPLAEVAEPAYLSVLLGLAEKARPLWSATSRA